MGLNYRFPPPPGYFFEIETRINYMALGLFIFTCVHMYLSM